MVSSSAGGTAPPTAYQSLVPFSKIAYAGPTSNPAASTGSTDVMVMSLDPVFVANAAPNARGPCQRDDDGVNHASRANGPVCSQVAR